MPEGAGGIATRQKAGALYTRLRPLGAGEITTSPVFEISGFSELIFTAIADTSFLSTLEEANRPEGPFTPIANINSAPVGSLFRAADRIRPVGAFMRATIFNPGVAQQFFSALLYGIPA